MYDVVTNPRQKEGWLQIRIDPDFKREVQLVADARGLSVSALVHSLLKTAVRAERDQYPQLFRAEPTPAPVLARIESAASAEEAERDEIRRRLQEGIVPLAPTSDSKMPGKLQDKTHTQAKRRSQK